MEHIERDIKGNKAFEENKTVVTFNIKEDDVPLWIFPLVWKGEAHGNPYLG